MPKPVLNSKTKGNVIRDETSSGVLTCLEIEAGARLASFSHVIDTKMVFERKKEEKTKVQEDTDGVSKHLLPGCT